MCQIRLVGAVAGFSHDISSYIYAWLKFDSCRRFVNIVAGDDVLITNGKYAVQMAVVAEDRFSGKMVYDANASYRLKCSDGGSDYWKSRADIEVVGHYLLLPETFLHSTAVLQSESAVEALGHQCIYLHNPYEAEAGPRLSGARIHADSNMQLQQKAGRDQDVFGRIIFCGNDSCHMGIGHQCGDCKLKEIQIKATEERYKVGDTVLVVKDAFKGHKANICKVEEDACWLEISGFSPAISTSVKLDSCRKFVHIEVGDTVSITNGEYADETAVVVEDKVGAFLVLNADKSYRLKLRNGSADCWKNRADIALVANDDPHFVKGGNVCLDETNWNGHLELKSPSVTY
jgi:hypothetical protein